MRGDGRRGYPPDSLGLPATVHGTEDTPPHSDVGRGYMEYIDCEAVDCARPEFPTATLWDPVRSLLSGRHSVAMQLPGIGCDAPAGVSGTRYAYRDWVIDQLEAMDEPVDLVGHDQGSVIGQGVILARPDLINSWVLGGGVCADDFLWHRQARIWQNTGLGERWRDHFLSLDVDTRAGMLVAAGLPEIDAADVATGMDRRMFDHILPLYRSEPYLEDWAFNPTFTYPPGLVLWGRDDPYQAAEFGRVAAAASAARFHELACGHWWQVERPDEVAAELTAHWSKTGSAAA